MARAEKTRQELSTSRIVAVATELIERDGLGAFTMRALGRELGVSAMAVYGYFPSRDELLAAVLERFMDTLDTRPVPGERWDDTLRRTMTSIYREEMAHPEIASIEVTPQVGANGLARHTDRIVNLHLSQGMPEAMLSQAWAMVDAFLTGFTANALALSRAAEKEGAAAPNEEQMVRLSGEGEASNVEAVSAGAPEGEVSDAGASDAIAAVAVRPAWQNIVAQAYTDEAFAHGVGIIIQGIRGLAAPDPCEWYTPLADVSEKDEIRP